MKGRAAIKFLDFLVVNGDAVAGFLEVRAPLFLRQGDLEQKQFLENQTKARAFFGLPIFGKMDRAQRRFHVH